MSVASTSSRSPAGVPSFAPHTRLASASAAAWSALVRMGFTSFMLHLRRINVVVLTVCAEPLDPDDALVETHSHHQPVAVALDVERDALGAQDARRPVMTLHVGHALPSRFPHFVEPGVECGLQRSMIPVPGATPDVFQQRPPSDDPHGKV